MRILAIARLTFREIVRDKALYVLLFLALIALLGSKALGWVSVGQDVKIVKDVSLAALSLFGTLIAVFAAARLAYQELIQGRAFAILCRPVHRYEYILGKYLGLAFLSAVVTGTLAALSGAYIVALGGTVDGTFACAVWLIYWQLLLITAVGTLLSTVALPIVCAFVTLFVYAFGHASGVLINLPPQFQGTATASLLKTAYYVLPNLNNFNIRAEAANGVAVSAGYVGWATAYGTTYIVLLLILAALVYEEEDV